MEKALISILIPCYNADKYLEKCLEHILNQTYKKLEIILIDDGSTDNSSNICKEYANLFEKNNMIFKYIYQDNKGIGGAINTGLKHITGKYFSWIDSDDYYEYDAIESLYCYLLNNKEYNMVRGKAYRRLENKEDMVVHEAKSKYPDKYDIFDLFLFEKDSYQFSGVFMCKTEAFDKAAKNRNIYPSRAGQNYQLVLPVAYNSKCGYLDKFVLNYIIREDSHSHSVNDLKKQLNRCDDHKDILFNTINEIETMKMPTKLVYKIRIIFKSFKQKIKIIIYHILKKVKRIIKWNK